MDKPLEHPDGFDNPPNLLKELLTILIFTGGIALLATALTFAMAYLIKIL